MKHRIRRKRKSPRTLALQQAGVTYGQVAAEAGVTWRMVKFWVDEKKTSANVEAAYYTLLARAKGKPAA